MKKELVLTERCAALLQALSVDLGQKSWVKPTRIPIHHPTLQGEVKLTVTHIGRGKHYLVGNTKWDDPIPFIPIAHDGSGDVQVDEWDPLPVPLEVVGYIL
jgi:hypothetical protein